MRDVIRAYVNECFERAKAPESNAVRALKKEVYSRMCAAARYFRAHGLQPTDAVNAAAKTVTNIRAMWAAAVREERKKEASHTRVKAFVIAAAMIVLVLSPLPIIKGLSVGFIITLGMLASGACLLIYAERSKPGEVDASEICDRFEIGMVRRRDYENRSEKAPKRENKPPARVKNAQKRDFDYAEEDNSEELPGKTKTVYGTTSKLLWAVCAAVYVICGLVTKKWIICLTVFAICFSLTRLAKAFTDFFKSGKDAEGPKKNAGRNPK